ncbi:UNVERIFIED_CONTAM: hypothetical protein GTU68_014434 [Idotea baltica]|nr:hypothetical protein [Idotea baltica]
MERRFMILAGLNGFLAVALGAFGAHGLKGYLEGLEDAAQRLAWWETAAHYHLTHALALAAIAWLAGRTTTGLTQVSGWGFQLGILLFSGSLYVMTLTGIRVLGAVTPIGGVGLLVGWMCLLLAARKLPQSS